MSPVPKSFKAEIQRLLIQPGVEGQAYFHVTRLANAAGELTVSVDSHWGGYITFRPRREIREASPLDGHGRHNSKALPRCENSGHVRLRNVLASNSAAPRQE